MFKCLKKLFKNKETISFPNTNKIALIAGHTKRSGGAINYLGESEYSFASRVLRVVKLRIGENCKLFLRDEGGLSAAYKNAAEWGANTSLELHFNSYDSAILGSEMLVSGESDLFNETRQKAVYFMKQFNSFYRISLRHGNGIKVVDRDDRGGLNLYYANREGIKHSVLFEPVFANFKTEDSVKIFEHEQKFINFLAEYIVKMATS